MRALLVAGSLAAFTLLGTGLAQADPIIPFLPDWAGSSIPLGGDHSFGSSGLNFETGPTGSALGTNSLGSTSAPAGSSTSPARAEIANRIFAELFNLPA